MFKIKNITSCPYCNKESIYFPKKERAKCGTCKKTFVFKRFKGFVEEIDDKSFFARLEDDCGPDIRVTFNKANDNIKNKSRMTVGAYLTWEIKEKGKNAKTSSIVEFIDTGVWSQKELDRAKKRGTKLFKKLKWDEQ